MEQAVIAAGSNIGNRLQSLQSAGQFLRSLSETPAQFSSIWESEPVGPSKFPFLNAVAKISTNLPPADLLKKLKDFEVETGREPNPVRWAPRILDLDIIRYGHLAIEQESLIIPHPEYDRRLFVLQPMSEVDSGWEDPESGLTLSQMIKQAPQIKIQKTDLTW